MTRRLAAIAGWVLAVGCGMAVSAPAQSGVSRPVLEKLQQMDTDQDQRLSYAEIAAGFEANTPNMMARFRQLDANGNGVLDKDELPARRFTMLDLDKNGSVSADEFLVANSMQARDLVLRSDANRDGYITLEELQGGVQQSVADASSTYEEVAEAYAKNPQARQRLFTMLDTDKSGSIQSSEWPVPNTFGAVDGNKDGAISREEFMAAHYEVTKAIVVATDLNKDGRVTVAEVRQGVRRAAAEHQRRNPGR